jgi:hypothetical protein
MCLTPSQVRIIARASAALANSVPGGENPFTQHDFSVSTGTLLRDPQTFSPKPGCGLGLNA